MSDDLLRFVQDRVARFLEVDREEVTAERGFIDLGFDSMRAVDFKSQLEEELGLELRTTLVFDYPTPAALAAFLADEATDERSEPIEAQEPIAIVGLACRFPGAPDADAFWRLQIDGVDAVTEVPADRWPVDQYYDPERGKPGKMYSRWGGFLTDIDRFDAAFFGVSPREATQLDPQHRILLETTQHALEHAGMSPDDLRGAPVGVFVGMRESEYFDSQTARTPLDADTYYGTGNAQSTATGRISHTFGWTGPSLPVDTACSASLVAVHLAVASLRARECTMAVAGGVSLLLDPLSTIGLCRAGMLSPEGRCKTFSAAANGYVRAEGCGLLVLKPLSDALAANDRILAVVSGSAVNQDGASGGLTVPNGPAQQAVIRRALAVSGIEPRAVGYIEAHGTGTSLGDPIEVGALQDVFGDRDEPLLVGSVKTNIGHAETAAGIAGLIRTIQILEHGVVPPVLHLDVPNPFIPWGELSLSIPRVAEARAIEHAGVSSFGFSGTNAHIVLSRAPDGQATPREERPELLVLSAKTEKALGETIVRYRDRLLDEVPLADACYTAAVGRAHHRHRAALIADDKEGMVARLEKLAEGVVSPGDAKGAESAEPPRVAFLFTGQGSQYAGMSQQLYRTEPVFRAALDRCAALFEPDLSLLDVLFGEASRSLHQTELTQPALLAVGWSLAQLWRSWGVEPRSVLGHSVGEVAAACVAGVLGLEDAARLIVARGRLMKERTPDGAMLAVYASVEEIEPIVAEHADVSIAAINGDRSIVIAGAPSSVHAIEKGLEVPSERLTVSRAFHSPLMEPMLEDLRSVADTLEYHEPTIEMIPSSGAARSAAIFEPDYWVRHAREPVRFSEATRALGGCDILLEVGPKPVLVALAGAAGFEGPRLASLRPGQPDQRQMLSTLGQLYVRGVQVDWRAVFPPARRKVTLPAYPFERRRFWHKAKRRVISQDSVHPLLGRPLDSPAFAPGQSVFEADLGAEWLADHSVYDRIVFPAAGFVELALAAGVERSKGGRVSVSNLEILSPLMLEEETHAQVVVSADGGLSIFSRRGDEWIEHARALLEEVEVPAPGAFDPVEGPVDVDDLYERFERAGILYGPAFRGIRALHAAEGLSLAEIRLPVDQDAHHLHPALLDACFQSCAAAIGTFDQLHLPIAVDRISLFAACPAEVKCRASVRKRSASITMDLLLFAGSAPVAEIEGLRLVPASRAAFAGTGRLDERLYSVRWEASPRTPACGEAGDWTVIERGSSLSDALVARGAKLSDGAENVAFVPPRPSDPTDPEPVLKALTLVQSLAGTARRLFVLTQDPLGHAAVGGLLKTVALEHPELSVRQLEVEDVRDAVDDLLDPTPETLLRFQDGERQVPRLTRTAAPRRITLEPPGPDFALIRGESRTLDGIELAAIERRSPEEGQVEIEVEAAALNFRDALRVLGLIDVPGDEPPLGFECAGRVARVGAGVSLTPGTPVVATTMGAAQTHVTASEHLVRAKPDALTYEEAAAAPIAFMTAVLALEDLAGLRKDDWVMIHAAAGGVGQAAVQIAKRKGARIIASASAPKQAFLAAQGIDLVISSRQADFVDRVLEATDGQGVDVVLNSLSGDFIPRSLQVMAHGGRFVEIGKLDAWTSAQVAAERPDVRYSIFDLSEMSPAEYAALFQRVREGLDDGRYGPLPQTVFPIRKSVDAIEFLAKARHIGKVVLSFSSAGDDRRLRDDRTYVVTGGLGALGRSIAERMIMEGAGEVLLVQRSAPDAEAEAWLEGLPGAQVAQADVSDAERLDAALQRKKWPVAGVVHAAGLLDDGLLEGQTPERLQAVLAPKVQGAWNLHRATRDDDLDFFVCLSSISSVVGSPGQGPYVAANAFLDALAAERHKAGLPALTIGFGPFSDRGMAARMETRHQQRLLEIGVRPMTIDEGVDALFHLLDGDRPHVAVAAIDWTRFLRLGHAPMLEAFAPRAAAPSRSDAIERIRSAAPEQQAELFEELLATELARVLEYGSAEDVDRDKKFTHMGMDSLLAVDLKNRLESALGESLPATTLFDHPTISALAEHLARGPVEEAAPVQDGDAELVEELEAELKKLTEQS